MRNYNKPLRWAAVPATVLAGSTALGACGSHSSRPNTCQSPRSASHWYAAFPGATSDRRTWGGTLLYPRRLNTKGLTGIVVGWEGAGSNWKWDDSRPLPPAQLENQSHKKIPIAVSVGNLGVRFSIKFIGRTDSAACSRIPGVNFGAEPTAPFSEVRQGAETPVWGAPKPSDPPAFL
jgi:hypothetical protein